MFRIIFLIAFLLSSVAFSKDITFITYTDTSAIIGSTVDLLGGGTASSKVSQTFTTTSSIKVTHFSAYPYCTTKTACNISAELWTTSGGTPSAKIASTENIVMPTTSTPGTPIVFRFPTGITLSATTQYAIVFSYIDASVSFKGSLSGSYSGGSLWYYNGTTWNNTATSDLAFTIYGTTQISSKSADVESGYYTPTYLSANTVELPQQFAATGGTWGYTIMTGAGYFQRVLFKAPIGMAKNPILTGYIGIALGYTGTTPNCSVQVDLIDTTGTTAMSAGRGTTLLVLYKACSAISSCESINNTKTCYFDLPSAGIEITSGKNLLIEVHATGTLSGTECPSQAFNTFVTSNVWDSVYSSNYGSTWTQSSPIGAGYYLRFFFAPPKTVFYSRIKNIVTVNFIGAGYITSDISAIKLTLPIGRTDGTFASTRDMTGALPTIGGQSITIPSSNINSPITTISPVMYSLKNVP